MQIEYLKFFVDVVDKGTIASAASDNFVSSQGMSRAMKVLEEELGCELFRRASGKLILTQFGEAVYVSAREILHIWESLFLQVSALRQRECEAVGKKAKLFLNNVAFDGAFFNPLMESFSHLFEDACYYQCDNNEVVRRLIESDDDSETIALGLMCCFSPLEDENKCLIESLRKSGFAYQPYLTSYDMVLVSKKSPLAKKSSLAHADILSKPIVSSDGDIRRVAEKLFGEDSVYMVTGDNSFRFNVVAKDEALTFVPALFCLTGQIDDQTVAVPMKDPYFLEIGFAARRQVLDSLVVQNLFARLNSFYLKNIGNPYISLVQSDITAFSFSDDDAVVRARRSLEAFSDRFELSQREREVLSYLDAGLAAQAIANEMSVSVTTAKTHIANIYRKSGVHTRQELVSLARKG